MDVADESAPNYLRWISDLISPHLGHRVLELGAGLGSITELWAAGHEVVVSDLSAACVAALHRRFAYMPEVTVVQKDVRELTDEGQHFDSIVMINVLEHIADDAGVLASMRQLLVPGGTVAIYVPALNALYGPWDRRVGHFRRYSKWRLHEVAREAGLDVVDLRYVNLLALPAWLAFSHSNIDKTAKSGLSIWDRTGVPAGRALESRVRVPIGLNILSVLRVSERL